MKKLFLLSFLFCLLTLVSANGFVKFVFLNESGESWDYSEEGRILGPLLTGTKRVYKLKLNRQDLRSEQSCRFKKSFRVVNKNDVQVVDLYIIKKNSKYFLRIRSHDECPTPSSFPFICCEFDLNVDLRIEKRDFLSNKLKKTVEMVLFKERGIFRGRLQLPNYKF